MSTDSDSALITAIASAAEPLNGASGDYDSLLTLIGDARFVLLGEASHGTHEFYHERTRITQRLIAEKGFNAVAVEADWPDAYRVNRHVRGLDDDADSEQALAGFKRFPSWMWRNTDVVAFVDWLRAFNRALPSPADAAGFYGLDLYSLFTSIGEILQYLDKVDPAAAQRARRRYACFDHFEANSQRYGYAAGFGLSPSCEDAVVAQLQELQKHAADDVRHDGVEASDALFHARQNARLVMNAEEYYRSMFHGRVSSWNLRDRHMMETLDALAQHLADTRGKPAKIVVWEHNSHIGDARATEVGRQGEWTVGQLARQRYGDETRLIGFTTCHGTVTAASDWDGRAERKRVRPALAGSYEDAFHRSGIGRFMLPFKVHNAATRALGKPRLERAIGVIYLPHAERQSHYFYASLPRQFDAVLHIDETRAVQPLEWTSHWETGEAPGTFPVGV
ncbi:erythromycin esterase family protein [Massilia sp. CCM 9210]|uniref:erythromycin esterase family protein n=1 Tax=Massilia scottii TaxID=3057166 RepID=UPI002796C6CA|nr:erythromycin esterase family protein [Massilia sp. CCM 9210]MDQ1815290.1 erythromycin esterase family protein [Massilia sp. CCM 9210]